jgi:hypothetical protein
MQGVAAAALFAAFLAGTSALAQEQSAALFVTATVVSTCRVEVPRTADASAFATMPVLVTCARGSRPRVQRPTGTRIGIRDAVLVIDF